MKADSDGQARSRLPAELDRGIESPPREVLCRVAAIQRTGLRGFTLIEVMIAMAILMMILLAIYSSWSAIVRGSKVGLDAAAQVQRSRIAMASLVDSLLTVQMFGGNPGYYAFIADTSSDYAYLSLVSRLPGSFPDAGLFGDQVVRRVTFQVERGKDAGNDLVMYQMPIMSEVNEEQKPFALALAHDVSVFSLEFWDTRRQEWAKEWLPTNQLPEMVRVTLGLGNVRGMLNEPQNLMTRVIALPAMAIPAQYQMSRLPPGQSNQPPAPNNMNPAIPGQPGPGQPNMPFYPNQPGIGSFPGMPPGGFGGGRR
ncbi:MAG: prepilin-type N-terminal cleavage/methylation domain-containing protein [Candidatus Omnitrophica bacterium]|nr:prepilin-type N-terminal cleavage/methylation domain-containing protein [Candidatus Omnitrophota bacterium]